MGIVFGWQASCAHIGIPNGLDLLQAMIFNNGIKIFKEIVDTLNEPFSRNPLGYYRKSLEIGKHNRYLIKFLCLDKPVLFQLVCCFLWQDVQKDLLGSIPLKSQPFVGLADIEVLKNKSGDDRQEQGQDYQKQLFGLRVLFNLYRIQCILCIEQFNLPVFTLAVKLYLHFADNSLILFTSQGIRYNGILLLIIIGLPEIPQS